MTAVMTRSSTYQIRIDAATKKESFEVFQSLGMTPAQGVRVFLQMVANTGSIPFQINQATAKVLEDVDAGRGLHSAKDADDLFQQLGI